MQPRTRHGTSLFLTQCVILACLLPGCFVELGGTGAGPDTGIPPRTDAGRRDAGDGGGGGIEDCTDGVDNDDDGDVDCADADCGAYECVDAPDGWSMPGALLMGEDGSAAECDSALGSEIFVGHRGVVAEAASCSSCECGNPTATDCAVSRAEEYSTTACTGLLGTASLATSGICYASAAAGVTWRMATVGAGQGTCDLITPAMPTVSPPGWASEGRLCAFGGGAGGCGSGQVCVPRVPPSADRCVVQPGLSECPAGYESRQLLFEGVDDRRGCTTCGCVYRSDDPSCVADLTAYASTGCAGTVLYSGTITSGTTCRTGNPASFRFNNVRHTSATCNNNGGNPEGCVIPAEPTTVCCAPDPGEPTCPAGRGPAMVSFDVGGELLCVDSTEVTNAQYQEFLDAGFAPMAPPAECLMNDTFVPEREWPGNPDEPVVWVDWCDAWAYCEWAGKSLCGAIDGGPTTEAEAGTPSSQWYYACSEGGSRRFAYGDTFLNACTPIRNPTDRVDATTLDCCMDEVSYLFGMSSNVAEWIDACVGDSCVAMGDDRNDGECDSGGSPRTYSRTSGRNTVGFRCCAP